MTDMEKITESVKTGNRNMAKEATTRELEAGTSPMVLLDAMVLGMDDVGRRFRNNEIFVPEVLISARAMKEGMALLEPKLVAAGYKPLATFVIGTVAGDLHDIGKNLVTMLWRGASFAVHDLGVNTSTEKFLAAIEQHQPQIVGMSALLTTTIPSMRETMKAIRAANLPVKVMVGGAPVTKAVADDMGADGWAQDAVSAVLKAKELLGIGQPA